MFQPHKVSLDRHSTSTCSHLTSRLLTTDHHLESQSIAALRSTAITTWRRPLHQLTPPAAMRYLTPHHDPVDRHKLLTPTVLSDAASAASVSPNHRCRAVHSSTHPRLWHLSAAGHRLHGGCTPADLSSLDLCANRSIQHHTESHALRHINDCPWTGRGSSARPRHLLRRSRCSLIRCQCKCLMCIE